MKVKAPLLFLFGRKLSRSLASLSQFLLWVGGGGCLVGCKIVVWRARALPRKKDCGREKGTFKKFKGFGRKTKSSGEEKRRPKAKEENRKRDESEKRTPTNSRRKNKTAT